MADPINIPHDPQAAGVPYQWEQEINPGYVPLITGDQPALVTMDLVVAASQTIAALTPVGFNGSGNLVPAVNGTTAAIGILVAAVVSGSGTTKGAPVYRAGCFNPDAINWPASYDTEAKRMNAFEGAPTPTQIVMRRPKAATVTPY
jgi:hypothetical protein